MDKWGFKPCMITLGYDPFQSVNHGVPGSSPGEGANRKVIRNGDFFRLKSISIPPINRFSWFEPSRGFSIFTTFLVGDYTCDFLFVPRMCQEFISISKVIFLVFIIFKEKQNVLIIYLCVSIILNKILEPMDRLSMGS